MGETLELSVTGRLVLEKMGLALRRGRAPQSLQGWFLSSLLPRLLAYLAQEPGLVAFVCLTAAPW